MKPSLKSVIEEANERLGPTLENLGLEASVANSYDDDVWIKFVGKEKPVFSNVVINVIRDRQGCRLEQLCVADYKAQSVGSRKHKEKFFIRNQEGDKILKLSSSDPSAQWFQVGEQLSKAKIIENAATNRHFLAALDEITPFFELGENQIGCERKDGINSWLFAPKKNVACRLSVEGKEAVLYINDARIASLPASNSDNIGTMMFNLEQFLDSSERNMDDNDEDDYEPVEGFQGYSLPVRYR